MPWDAATDPRWAAWWPAAWGAAAAVAAVALAALADLRAPASPRRAIAVRLAGLAAAIAALAGTVAHAAPGVPAWDQGASQALRAAGTALASGAALLAWLADLPAVLGAATALLGARAARGRWREAYLVIGALALVGLVAVLHVLLPRAPPTAAPFGGPAASFPAVGAAALPVLAWLAGRGTGRMARAGLLAGACLLSLAPVLAGQAWLTDVAAGWALAAVWGFALAVVDALAVPAASSAPTAAPAPSGSPVPAGSHAPTPVASPAASSPAATPLPRTASGRAPRRVGAALVDAAAGVGLAILRRPRPWLLGAVALGVAARALASWWAPLGVDAFTYAAMGRSWLADGTFWMPWGDVHTYDATPAPSHHYPPLYPVVLAGAFALGGYQASTVHVVGFVTGLAAILVTYLCSRDLYGPTKGLAAAAVVAVTPMFVQATGQGYSENLVLLLFVATMWAILRSLESPWMIVPAGALAGLGYLTKSSMGYFFVIAGLGGLAWRLHWKGWRVLRDPAYVTAILAFGLLAAGWALRNLLVHGSWETSRHLTEAYGYALSHPLQWAERILVTLPFYLGVGYLVYMGLAPWMARLARMPRLESEHDSGLWLAFGLPLLLTSAIDAALWLVEREFYVNNVRYVGFVVVPLAWLVLRNARPDRGTAAALAVTAVILVAGTAFFALPKESPLATIAADLRPLVADGESVGFVDLNIHAVYRFHFDLTRDGTRDVHVQVTCVSDPHCPATTPRPASLTTDWVLMQGQGGGQLPDAYQLVEGTHAQYDERHPHYVSLWRRAPGGA